MVDAFIPDHYSRRLGEQLDFATDYFGGALLHRYLIDEPRTKKTISGARAGARP